MKPSIFVGSFNMNCKDISEDDALKWFQQNENSSSDMIILSLQECPTAPAASDSSSILPCIKVFGDKFHKGDKVQQTIQSSLTSFSFSGGDDYILLADMAMGEVPTNEHTIIPKPMRFYGHVRLMVFVKKPIASYLEVRHSSNNDMSTTPLVIPIFAPVGRKESSPSGISYPKNRSPDKGGVCLAIPSLEIFISSLHLCATTEYNTPEVEYDRIRFNELGIILQDCEEILSKTISVNELPESSSGNLITDHYQTILCGDLNFRVEMFSNPADKSRGGNDFQGVHRVIKEGNSESLKQMFYANDGLVRAMRDTDTSSEESTPAIEKVKDFLKSTQDVFAVGAHQPNANLPLPTFTLSLIEDNEISAGSQPRVYSEKRTPSWTDRVLIDKKMFQRGYILQDSNANFDIQSSDHAPIFASIGIP